MYCSHFGLHRPPFNNTPDPTFYFGTPEHEEALATLQYAVAQRKGFVLVTGEVGAGKTLVGRMFLRQADRNVAVAVISHTHLTGRQLLAAICSEFELQVPPDATSLDLTERLQSFLLQQFAQDRFAVVLLDEAQNLPDESFEELRMLGNLEADDAKLLQVCILGQPELLARFRQPALQQIDQRLFRRFHLSALSRPNTEAYIRHRLRVAGCTTDDLFMPEAIGRIYDASRGIPRLINQICDNALLAAYAENADRVTEAIIEQSREFEARLPDRDAPAPLAQAPAAAEVLSPALARQMDAHRREIQGALDQSIARCRAIEDQFRQWAAQAVPREALQQLRRDHEQAIDRIVADIARQGQRFTAVLAEAEKRWEKLGKRAPGRTLDAGEQATLESLQMELDDKVHELLARLDRHRQHISQLAEALKNHCAQTQNQLEGLRSDQTKRAAEIEQRLARGDDALGAQVAQQAQRITALDQQVGDRIAAVQDALRQLETHGATTHDLDRVRQEQAAGVAGIQQLAGRQGEQIARLREDVDRQAGQHHERQEALAGQFDRRLADQSQHLERLRAEMTDSLASVQRRFEELRGRFAERAELQALRAEHAAEVVQLHRLHEARADEILSRMQANRTTLRKVVVRAVARFRAAQARLDALASSSAPRTELQDVQRRMREESRLLLEQLESHRSAAENQFNQVIRTLHDTQSQLDALAGSAAPAADLDRFRQEHAGDRERLLAMLGAHQRDLEALAEETRTRCDAMQAGLDALPHDIATADRVEEVRRECTDQIRRTVDDLSTGRERLEQSVRHVQDYCDRTHAALLALTAEAATTGQLHALRDEHGQQMGEIRQRVEDHSRKQSHHLHLLTRRVREHAQRVASLEDAGRRPVRLELAPRAGAELGEIVEAAQSQHGRLAEEVRRADAVATHLNDTSSQVRESLQEWSDTADGVRQESAQLRAAATTAAGILDAMRKCHAAIDRKLNSQRWHHELARGEAVAQRLEKASAQAQTTAQQLNAALRDFDACQESADDWAARNRQTQQTIAELSRQAKQAAQHLSKLLADASSVSTRFDQSLNRRKQVLGAVARNTARLMDLIDAARQADASIGPADRTPTPAGRTTSDGPHEVRTAGPSARASDVDWPTLRVRTAHTA